MILARRGLHFSFLQSLAHERIIWRMVTWQASSFWYRVLWFTYWLLWDLLLQPVQEFLRICSCYLLSVPNFHCKSVLYLLKCTANLCLADAVQFCGTFWETPQKWTSLLGHCVAEHVAYVERKTALVWRRIKTNLTTAVHKFLNHIK